MGFGERFRKAWIRFWFAEQSTLVLALIRVGTGAVLLLTKLNLFGLVSQGGIHPIVPATQFHLSSAYAIPSGYFSLPYLSWLSGPSLEVYSALETVLWICVIACTLGFLTAVTTKIVFVVFAYLFFSSQFYYYHHLYVYLLTFGVLAFSPCGEYFALDRWVFRNRTRMDITRNPSIPILQVLIPLVYLFNALSKSVPEWFSGEVIAGLFASGGARGWLVDLVYSRIPPWIAGTAVVLCQYFLGVGFWMRRTRVACVIVGAPLHFVFMSAMYVSSISVQMWVLYLCFFEPRRLAASLQGDGNGPA